MGSICARTPVWPFRPFRPPPRLRGRSRPPPPRTRLCSIRRCTRTVTCWRRRRPCTAPIPRLRSVRSPWRAIIRTANRRRLHRCRRRPIRWPIRCSHWDRPVNWVRSIHSPPCPVITPCPLTPQPPLPPPWPRTPRSALIILTLIRCTVNDSVPEFYPNFKTFLFFFLFSFFFSLSLICLFLSVSLSLTVNKIRNYSIENKIKQKITIRNKEE